jgi:ComF family protein
MNGVMNMTPSDFAPRSRLQRLGFKVWPGTCALCFSASDLAMDLCRHCLADLPWNDNACRRCALPLAATRDRPLCGACFAKPPPQALTLGALRYEQEVPAMVGALKFRRSLVHGRMLAQLMTGTVRASYRRSALPELLLPVPMSNRRLLWRGHNQAAVLARYLGREFDIAIDCDRLRRIRHTRPQTGQRRAMRLRNLRGAFALTQRCPPITVAIVDDVMTTGTTVRALSRLLLAGGARTVHVWVTARTPARGHA